MVMNSFVRFHGDNYMRRISISILLTIVVMSLANGQTRQAFRNEKVERELKELVRIWDTASVNHDAAALDRLLAEEFTLSGTSKADYLAFIKSPSTVIESEVSDNFDVRVYKDMAVLIARDTIKLRRNGAAVVEIYRYVDVWVKRHDRWQCLATESCEIKRP
jgi:ketosteroid isomerase-like protein